MGKQDALDKAYSQGFKEGYDQGGYDRAQFYAREIALSFATTMHAHRASSDAEVTATAAEFAKFLGQKP